MSRLSYEPHFGCQNALLVSYMTLAHFSPRKNNAAVRTELSNDERRLPKMTEPAPPESSEPKADMSKASANIKFSLDVTAAARQGRRRSRHGAMSRRRLGDVALSRIN